MPGPEIPGTDHVCRFCGGSKCDDGQPLGAAFMPRREEPYLSTNWLEYTGAPSRPDQLAAIRQHLTNKGRKLSANGRLAVLHLQTVIDQVRSSTPDARTLAAHHEPEPADPTRLRNLRIHRGRSVDSRSDRACGAGSLRSQRVRGWNVLNSAPPPMKNSMRGRTTAALTMHPTAADRAPRPARSEFLSSRRPLPTRRAHDGPAPGCSRVSIGRTSTPPPKYRPSCAPGCFEATSIASSMSSASMMKNAPSGSSVGA